jgi:large subunit ribosomal protein L16
MKFVNYIKKNHIYKNKGKKKNLYKNSQLIIGVYSTKNLTLNQYNLKMLSFFLKKKLKKVGTIWFKVFLNLNNTRKPSETRMGKGKGPIFEKLVYLRKNNLIFTINKKHNISNYVLKQVLNKLQYKLPKYFKIIYKIV